MLRAVRFAASHDFVIEPAAWESICELASTISRVSPARLYEEIQKLFLLGSARPAFVLLEKSGLLAALFPSLGRWIYGNSHRLTLLDANLEWLDRLCRSGTPPTPALFLAALFGPSLEETALARHRDGIPRQQALDKTCAIFMEEISRAVCIPGRVGGRLRAALALQPSLQRMPPRRPVSSVGRPEFQEALAYLRLTAETRGEHRATLEWWDAFLLEAPSVACSEPPTDEDPRKRRRKKRRRHRRAHKAAV
jgi:poly(A) polymerase